MRKNNKKNINIYLNYAFAAGLLKKTTASVATTSIASTIIVMVKMSIVGAGVGVGEGVVGGGVVVSLT